MNLKTIVNTALLSTALALPAKAQIRPTIGYNSLENAAVVQSGQSTAVRTRLYTNFGLADGKLHLDYSGFNELNNLNMETWFGRQAFYLSAGGPGAALVVRNGMHAIYDVIGGVHFPVTGNGFYGFVDVVAGKVDERFHWNTTGYVGHSLAKIGKGDLSGFVFWSLEGHDPQNVYTETEVDYKPGVSMLGLSTRLFGRFEQNGLGKNTHGLFGMALEKS